MSNGWGDYQVTRETNMAAYDTCPPRLRWAMAYAQGPYAAPPVLKAHRDGIPDAVIIRAMRQQDREDTLRHYGPTHPEAARHV